MEEKISVILPTYNAADFIKLAINSVLKQNYQNLELIVIDDGSTDDTENLMKEYAETNNVKYIRKSNGGPAAARNMGAKIAEGEYLAFLDADDVWIDCEKLNKQIDFLKNNKDYGMVGSNVIVIDAVGRKIGKSKLKQADKDIRSVILRANQFFQSTIMIRKKVLFEIGSYNESEKYISFEDYDLWLRIGINYKFYNLSDYSVAYRNNPTGLSVSKSFKQNKGCFLAMSKYRKYYPNRNIAFAKGLLALMIPREVLIWKKKLLGF